MAAHIQEVEQEAVPDPEKGSLAPGSWKGTTSQVSSLHLTVALILGPATCPRAWLDGDRTTSDVHWSSGAIPPWMVQDEEHSSGNQQIGPSYEDFLKEKEKQKLKTNPPTSPSDKVGVNFDNSSSTSAGWLPSFGRVWNRHCWQSWHQFKTEAAVRNKQQRKWFHEAQSQVSKPTLVTILCDCLTLEKDIPTYWFNKVLFFQNVKNKQTSTETFSVWGHISMKLALLVTLNQVIRLYTSQI